MVSFGYKAFYVENLSLAEQNPACSVGQPWPGEEVVLCTLSLCTTGSPVWPWWQNSGALLASTDGPVLEACTEDASCPPLPLFLPSVAFPFPKGFFPFFYFIIPQQCPAQLHSHLASEGWLTAALSSVAFPFHGTWVHMAADRAWAWHTARHAPSSGLRPAPVCHPLCLCQGLSSWGVMAQPFSSLHGWLLL